MSTRLDTITRSISIDHPIDRVWAAITTAEELALWFGDSADVDLSVGGSLRFGWSQLDDARASGIVERIEPNRCFAFRWWMGDDPEPSDRATLVTFTLVATAPSSTTVTVVESGLDDLPDDVYASTIRENSQGWEEELADLAMLLAGVR